MDLLLESFSFVHLMETNIDLLHSTIRPSDRRRINLSPLLPPPYNHIPELDNGSRFREMKFNKNM